MFTIIVQINEMLNLVAVLDWERIWLGRLLVGTSSIPMGKIAFRNIDVVVYYPFISCMNLI